LKKDDKIQNKTLPYDFPVELEIHADGNVVARCPQLPGCRAQGHSAKEAMERLKNTIGLYFHSAAPAAFESLELFPDISTFYNLLEFRGYLYAATGRDMVLRSPSAASGAWEKIPVTQMNSKFYIPGYNPEAGEGDYATQVYCLCAYAPPGMKSTLFAGTNLSGSIYQSFDGTAWRDAFSTGEDRVHTLVEFKNRLYAGTSSKGKIFAFDGSQWNSVGSLNEAAVTSMGSFNDRLYAGTYPSGLIFSTFDGLNWEEMIATGQNFVQCFKEFKGSFYAGTSGPKGVKIFRTQNARDWTVVYESSREHNIYCMEEYVNTLYAGTGNSGRILKTEDGLDWRTAYAGDEEGVRSFALFGDYLYACTENKGALLRSTFDMARFPELSELKVEKVSSSTALITWYTDIASTSEVHFGEKADYTELTKVISDESLVVRHRVHLTDLKAETEYEFKVVSACRSSSLSASSSAFFHTLPVPPPAVTSPSHPNPGKWEKETNLEVLLHTQATHSGYYFLLDDSPVSVPAPPDASFTEEGRVAFSNLLQGVWYFHVAGVDEAGNIGTDTAHYQVKIDNQALAPPAIGSSSHPDPDTWVANPTPVIAWEKPEDLSGIKGYYVKADHEPATLPSPGNGDFTTEALLTLGPLEDGLWYVHVSTEDYAGNLGQEAAHYAIRIDTKTQAPAISSPTHPQGEQWYSNNRVEVVFTPPYDLSGVAGYYYCLDAEPLTLPSPETAAFSDKHKALFEDVKDGVWYLHVRAKDKADNLSPQATHFKFCIDTQASPPQVASATHSEAGRWYKDRRVVLNWEDPFEHSGIEGFYYNIDRKADTVPNDSTSLFTKEHSVSFELTDDGLWYFHITSKDKAGNVDWKSVHYPVRIDTEVGKPAVTCATHPDEEHWYPKTRAIFKLGLPDDLSGVTGCYYTFSEDPKAAPDPRTSTFTDKTEVVLDIPRDGVHFFSVIAQDAAGNVSKEPAVFHVRLDTSVGQPEVSSPSHPDPNRWYGSKRVEITWKDPPDLSGIEGFFVAFNDQEIWTPDFKAMTWTTAKGSVFTAPEDGIWFAHIVVQDKAGNTSACEHFRVQVDSMALPPVIKSPSHPPLTWVKTTVAKFTWEKPNELSGVEGYYVLLDRLPHTIPGPGNGKWVTETSINAPALKDGRWFFHASTKDMVGNLSQEASHYAFLIDTQPPKSKMKTLPPIVDRSQLSLEWEAADPNAEVVSYDVQVRIENGPWTDWLTFFKDNSAVYQAQDGKRVSFRCRARDAAGNQENYPDAEMAVTTIDISPPPAVTQVKAVPKAGGDIELKWSPVNDPVSGTGFYRLYRWEENGKRERISTDGEVTSTAFTDAGSHLKDNTVYYYCVQPVDKMGNEQHEGNATVACLSDHGVGVPVVTSPSHSSNDWSSNATAILVWDAPADATGIAGYYWWIDQSPSSRQALEQTQFIDQRRLELPGLTSGVWYLHVLAKDKAGNISEQAGHYRLKIDVDKPSAPQVTSETHLDPDRWYSAGKAAFHLESAPKLSGVDAFYYAFDRQNATVPLPSEAQRTTEPGITVKVNEPGTWWLHAVVRDKAGNFSEPTHYRIQACLGEMPPPNVASLSHPKEDEAYTVKDPHFTWEDRHDGSHEVSGYVYKLTQHENDKLTSEDAFTSETSVRLKDVGEGTWFFRVGAVGKEGKLGALSAVRKIVIERIAKLKGAFLRKDGITPVIGAKVEIARGDKIAASASTDEKGRFFFPALPEGRYEIRLFSDQFPVLRMKDLSVVASDDGLVDWTFVEDMGLLPNPPEPGPIRFYYFLKEDCNVSLEIFDATGSLIERMEERKEGGAYNVTIWDAAHRSEGDYLYKLSAKNVTRNAMSRFLVKKFRLKKVVKEFAVQPAT
jgi:predicted RNase H-like HicB family nuclease